jgi:hypothetical protein
MSIKICKQFNLCIKEFNNDLLKMSSASKLRILIFKINTLFKMNICSTVLINKFVENCMPLNELIEKKDPIFFNKLIEQEKNGEFEFYDLMVQLHFMWDGLSKNNRDNIFRYLQILNFCAEKYIKEYLKTKNQ